MASHGRARVTGRLAQRRVVFLVVFAGCVGLLGVGVPGSGGRPGSDPTPSLSPDAVAALFERPLPGVDELAERPAITGDAAADAHIAALAEARGYRRRGLAVGGLATVQGQQLQQSAADDFVAMADAVRTEVGADLRITSAFRSVAFQRDLFLRRLQSQSLVLHGRYLTNAELALGLGDDAIDATLAVVSIPGYSKHHTGLAVDVGSGGRASYSIREAPGWQWLTADGFANALRFGWIPSYPDGAGGLGPDPEPWEWVWIGRDAAACAVAGDCAVGGLDALWAGPSAEVVGWAVDADGARARRLRGVWDGGAVALGGAPGTVRSRFDVAAGRDLAGPAVGFVLALELPEAATWVCVEASSPPARWSRIGCAPLPQDGS